MERDALRKQLQRHLPADPREREMTARLLAFVEENPACFSRSLRAGHVTGSAWVVDPGRTCAVLVYHRRLERWLQPGGHCEADGSVQATALREAQEETGLRTLRLASPEIFDVDIHLIPARGAEPDHLHYDIRYLLEADPAEPLRASSESRAVQWMGLERIPEFTTEESVLRMVRKTGPHRTAQANGPGLA
jgi:8-oxo-dGTP pyrophosphatase MutT (NUDIX family)